MVRHPSLMTDQRPPTRCLEILLIPLLTPNDSAGPEAGITIGDITDNPNAFIGQTVTVSGEVEDIVGPRAFTMGDEGFLFGEELLVVGAQGPAPTGGLPLVTISNEPASEHRAAPTLPDGGQGERPGRCARAWRPPRRSAPGV